MAYDARIIANWFVTRAQRDGKILSIMSLLKLIYFAHGWNLEMRKAPLIGNGIQAWQYGPVVPEVYHAFRSQGIDVRIPLASVVSTVTPRDETFLEQIYQIYGSMSPFQLSDLTHEDGGPWHIATQLKGWYASIPDDLIRTHFELKRAKANVATNA